MEKFLSPKIDCSDTLIIDSHWMAKNFGIESEIGQKISAIIFNQISKINPSENSIQLAFLEWKQKSISLYPIEELDIELFIKHNLLIYSIVVILNVNEHLINKHQKNQNFLDSCNKIFTKLDIPLQFEPLIKITEVLELTNNYFTKNFDKNKKIVKEDLFAELYQNLIANVTRHPQGEFYTHPKLAQLMIDEVYNPELSVLDPSCGSGTFLIKILNKIQSNGLNPEQKRKSIDKIFGFDINPLACVMSRANLILGIQDNIYPDYIPNIYERNSIFPNDMENKIICENREDNEHLKQNIKVDLIIGNPPWVVLNRIPSKNEKNKIKQIGKKLGIIRGGKWATSTELTTIFCYSVLKNNLNKKGQIFFVTPASLANAAQHEIFRQFRGLHDIEFWSFDQDVFRIHNLCFKARAGEKSINDRLKIQWKSFHCEVNPLKIQLISNQTYIPSKIELPKNYDNIDQIINLEKENSHSIQPIPNLLIGRLIPGNNSLNNIIYSNSFNKKNKKKSDDREISKNNSYYKDKFRQGASLVPRNLLFVDIENKTTILSEDTPESIKKIKPSSTIQSKKYSTWEFKAFDSALVEKKNIFPIAKSTGLIPYHYYRLYTAFLPLSIDSEKKLSLSIPEGKNSKAHFKYIQQLYSENIKTGAEIKTLEKRIDYGKALTDPNQLSDLKVIYAGIGSIVKAAILQDFMIIDTSIYFFVPSSLEEAYYLLGILNSPCITNYVKKHGSTGANGSLRNIHKHPISLYIQKYTNDNPICLKISSEAKKLENYVQNYIKQYIADFPEKRDKTKSIQNALLKNENFLFLRNLLDEIVKKFIF